MLGRLDAVRSRLVARTRLRDRRARVVRRAERRSIMQFNAIGGGRDAAIGGSSGYARAIDGLRGFDSLNAALRSHQDEIQHSAVAAASAYPRPPNHAPAFASSFASAVTAYASSDGGRRTIEGLAARAGDFLTRVFLPHGAEQLALPLE